MLTSSPAIVCSQSAGVSGKRRTVPLSGRGELGGDLRRRGPHGGGEATKKKKMPVINPRVVLTERRLSKDRTRRDGVCGRGGIGRIDDRPTPHRTYESETWHRRGKNQVFGRNGERKESLLHGRRWKPWTRNSPGPVPCRGEKPDRRKTGNLPLSTTPRGWGRESRRLTIAAASCAVAAWDRGPMKGGEVVGGEPTPDATVGPGQAPVGAANEYEKKKPRFIASPVRGGDGLLCEANRRTEEEGRGSQVRITHGREKVVKMSQPRYLGPRPAPFALRQKGGAWSNSRGGERAKAIRGRLCWHWNQPAAS